MDQNNLQYCLIVAGGIGYTTDYNDMTPVLQRERESDNTIENALFLQGDYDFLWDFFLHSLHIFCISQML